ncbi:MAG: hypothetical protein M3Q57_08790 [Pseudomonadota bacterium]|nr:hypothetical protein [Pseudomonadota bacterium]
MSDQFDYRLFGLHIRSDIALPELAEAARGDEPDIVISSGDVPRGLPATPGLHRDGDGVLLSIDGVARYWVAGGTRIVVAADPAVPTANVRLYLLGSAMGMLLHQRGLLPLHANAVEVDGKAYAFMGHSGAGKSTLAAWFHDRGFRVISDDVAVVDFSDEGIAFVAPGIPRLRLWRDALEASRREASLHERSWAGEDDYEKYDVPIAAGSRTEREAELGAVYLLVQGDRLSFTPLAGVEAIEALIENIYRGSFIPHSKDATSYWETCIRLARQAPVIRCERIWDSSAIESQALEMLAHIRRQSP